MSELKQSVLEQGFEGQAASMREFGYPDVTAEMIRAHHEAWMKHEEPKDVVAMFSERAFGEYPMIFGKRGENAINTQPRKKP